MRASALWKPSRRASTRSAVHLRWIVPWDQPRRGGLPRGDAAVITQFHDHPENRLYHVDHRLGLADFLSVISRTPAMVLVTSRPEYEGALTRVPGAQAIALAPLGNSDTEALIGELLGADPSVTGLAAVIAERAAGNPFFAEEMVRELV